MHVRGATARGWSRRRSVGGLATRPGGADTVAIIASSNPGYEAFLMGMQSARCIVVASCGPAVACFAARRIPA